MESIYLRREWMRGVTWITEWKTRKFTLTWKISRENNCFCNWKWISWFHEIFQSIFNIEYCESKFLIFPHCDEAGKFEQRWQEELVSEEMIMFGKVELEMIRYLPKSVSPSLKSLAAIRPVSPWAFLLPHWPKLLNCWPVFWALDGLESPDKRLPTWFNWDEGFVLKCWLDGAETNWVKPLLFWN